jgi:iron(III) transport system permease protein
MRFEELLERWEAGALSHAEAAAALGVSERTLRRWRVCHAEAATALGVSGRTFRRWRVRHAGEGAAGLVDRRIDRLMLIICSLIALAIVVMLAVAFFASIATFWPYNLTPSFKNYDFDTMDGGGWASYYNSLELGALTALFGTAIVFSGAYLIEKTPRFKQTRGFAQFLALLPLAVPGLVLGLGYIFFFNNPSNPLNFIYGTMTILVVCTVSHFYSVSHLTAVTALKQIDQEFETVSASLRVPFWRTFARVTLPVCLPAVLDIAMYLFVNAMTTVSAVVFLYSPRTTPAAIAVLNMDDAGDVAPAAAMAMLIFFTSAAIRTAYVLVTQGYLTRSQAWRKR